VLDRRRWSLARLIVSSLLWIVGIPLLLVGYVAVKIFIETRDAGASGIGAVSYGVEGWIALAVLFGPPLVATVVWVLQRRSSRQSG